LACQHFISGTNLRECEDQSWFKVQAFLCFVLIDEKCLRVPPVLRVPYVENHWHVGSNRDIIMNNELGEKLEVELIMASFKTVSKNFFRETQNSRKG
jgi:hypothetical protein